MRSWPSLASYFESKLTEAERKQWVMFENGSVILFIDRPDSERDSLEENAIEIMKRDGPVFPGSEHGDFTTIALKDGYVVTSHNPNLLIVHEGLIEGATDLSAGLLLRSRREKDAKSLKIIATSRDNRNQS